MSEVVSTCELQVLALLRARNREAAPALAVTKAATTLLTECTALEKQLDRERQATDLLVKERHEMVADMELLRQNEANGGVSREHIEQLRDLLEKSKTEAARSASEAAAARASDISTSEAARLMAGKLAEAQARAADLEHSLKIAAAHEQSLESENARLIERLTVQLQAQAMAMDSEREVHERQAKASSRAAELAPLYTPATPERPTAPGGPPAAAPAPTHVPVD